MNGFGKPGLSGCRSGTVWQFGPQHHWPSRQSMSMLKGRWLGTGQDHSPLMVIPSGGAGLMAAFLVQEFSQADAVLGRVAKAFVECHGDWVC